MSDIFQEVDEAVRHEEYKKLWRKYRWLIIGVVGGIVLGVAAQQGWQWYSAKQQAERSEAYAAAVNSVEEDRSAEARNALNAIINEGSGGYETLARLRLAEVRLDAGDEEGAVALLEEIAADGSALKAFRDLATILIVSHRLDQGDPQFLLSRLEPLRQAGEPFRASALELSGLLALRQGDEVAARQHLEALAADPGAAPGAGNRAQQLLALIGE